MISRSKVGSLCGVAVVDHGQISLRLRRTPVRLKPKSIPYIIHSGANTNAIFRTDRVRRCNLFCFRGRDTETVADTRVSGRHVCGRTLLNASRTSMTSFAPSTSIAHWTIEAPDAGLDKQSTTRVNINGSTETPSGVSTNWNLKKHCPLKSRLICYLEVPKSSFYKTYSFC